MAPKIDHDGWIDDIVLTAYGPNTSVDQLRETLAYYLDMARTVGRVDSSSAIAQEMNSGTDPETAVRNEHIRISELSARVVAKAKELGVDISPVSSGLVSP